MSLKARRNGSRRDTVPQQPLVDFYHALVSCQQEGVRNPGPAVQEGAFDKKHVRESKQITAGQVIGQALEKSPPRGSVAPG